MRFLHTLTLATLAFVCTLSTEATAQTRADWTRMHDSGSGAWATDVARDASGNLYVLGYTANSGADFDGDGTNDVPCSAYVVSYDAGGALRWSTPLVARSSSSGITCPSADQARAIAVSPQGDVFAIGRVQIYGLYAYYNDTEYTSPPQGQFTSYLARLDGASGAVADFRHYGGYSQSYLVASDIATDEDGGVYIAGWAAGTMNTDGLPGIEIPYGDGPPRGTGFFFQYDADLALRRTQYTGLFTALCGDSNPVDCSYSYNSVQSIDVRGGKIALGGSFVYGVHFRDNDGTSPFSLYNTDAYPAWPRVSDAYVAVYDTAFAFQWAKGLHGAGYNVSDAVALGPDGSVYHGQHWQQEYTLDPAGAPLYTSLPVPNNLTQAALTRFGPDGSYGWTIPFHTQGATSDDPRMMSRIEDIDASGDLVVVGGELKALSSGLDQITDFDISGDGKPELRDALAYRAGGRGFVGGYSPTSGNLVWHAFPGGTNAWAGRPPLSSATVGGVLHAPGGAIIAGEYQGQALDVNTDGAPDAPRARNQNGGFVAKLTRMTEPESGPSRALEVRDPRAAVEISHDDALDLASGSGLTVEAWYRRDAARVFRYDTGPFVWKGSTWVGSTSATFYGSSKTSPYSLGMGFSGVFRASVGDGVDADILDSTTKVAFDGVGANTDTTWYHIALTADGTTVRLYVNGVMEASTPQTVTVAGGARPLFLGGMTPIGASHANQDISGQIDGVRLWSRALSPDELAAKRHLRLDASAETGLVASYDFDAGHVPSIRDGSGNGHDGWLTSWAELRASTAPIGTGVAAAAEVTEETPTPLAGTDLAVGLVGASGTPRMQAVRLSQPPTGTQPTGMDEIVPTTWVIENVGSGSFGSANLAFTVAGLRPGADASGFALFRRPSGSEGPWEQVAASATSFEASTGTIRFDGVACCSQYAIGASGGALPVELTDFSASVGGSRAVLSWTTASETNNDGFTVETQRAGTWSPLGFIAGAGTTTEAQRYTFEVAELAPGTHRFRLRQTDYDGSVAYSAALEVAVGMEEAVRVGAPYPNPASGAASLAIAVRTAQTVEVAVFDVLGREVAVAARFDLEAAHTRILAFPTASLAPGLYLVRVTGETFTETRRLTVAR